MVVKKNTKRLLNKGRAVNRSFYCCLLLIIFGCIFASLNSVQVGAASPTCNPPTLISGCQINQSGSVGLEGTVPGAPPKNAPTITIPSNNQSFSVQDISVTGICQSGLLIKIFDNNVFVGSAQCISGSFKIKISLFNETNNLIARQYDALDQASPDSNSVKVTFSNGQVAAFSGPLLALTSNYAKRGADPGKQLSWPIIISGGTPPYALSVDWGDSTQPSLLSQSFAGAINLTHTYQTAGTYQITIQATDKNGETAFLQLVGVANGPVTQSVSGSSNTKVITKIIWWPLIVLFPLILLAYWLGGKQALQKLRNRLEENNN